MLRLAKIPLRLPALLRSSFVLRGQVLSAVMKVRASLSTDTVMASNPDAPDIASSTEPVEPAVTKFTDLGVPLLWQERLYDNGIRAPSETQRCALPAITSGQNVILKAETGSGKTLCYLLPILEAVRQRWIANKGNAPARTGTPSATALIVVPTQELAHQIIRVAKMLSPETVHLFRAVYADKGVSRRDDVGCIVATPTALKDNVNYHQLSHIKHLVLDEADMLLSGSYFKITQGYLLSMFKQREPDLRPQHIFCAATIPSKGKLSAQNFLDTYYPDTEVTRVTTSGAHKSTASVRQLFWQLDAELPLTLEEQETMARIQRQAEKTAKALLEDDSAAVRADDIVVEGAPVRGDAIRSEMQAREREDIVLDAKADMETYLKKVATIRNQALIDALLLPVRPNTEPAEAATSKRKRAARGPVVIPGFEADKDTPTITEKPAELQTALPHSIVPDAIVHYRGVAGARKLTPAQVAAIPPTLVFVNSAEMAENCRKFLIHACPDLGVGELHKNVDEDERRKQLEKFADGTYRVLVCTDVASRGLDTLNVEHVIQAEFANDIVTHLHRVGRTARAGRSGIVTNLVLRRNLALTDKLLDAMRAGKPVDEAFSRRRSLRKELKKAALKTAEDALLDQADEAGIAKRVGI